MAFNPFSYYEKETENMPPLYGGYGPVSVVHPSYESLQKACGDSFIPFERIELGEVAGVVFNEDPGIVHAWRPFGEVVPQIVTLSRDAYLSVGEQIAPYLTRQRVYRCDQPFKNLVGFIDFDLPGLARGLRIPMPLFRHAFHRGDMDGWLANWIPFWRTTLPTLRPPTGVEPASA